MKTDIPDFATLSDMISFRSRRSPEETAVILPREKLSYKELLARSVCLAKGLHKLGIKSGSRVVLALPNGTDFFVAFYGITRLGGIAIPLFPNSGENRLLAIASHCGAEFHGRGRQDHV